MTPSIRVSPSLENRLAILGRAAGDDVSCPRREASDSRPRADKAHERFIYRSALPNGGAIPVLKVLQQGGCERNCAYCAQRLGGVEGDPLSFTPDELARVFEDLYRRGKVRGVFLSTAIRNGPVRSMDRMLATAELLRGRYAFRGYLHLKIVPGSRPEQVERAMALASRVSVNMEAPTVQHLARIAPSKEFDRHILDPMRQVARALFRGAFSHGSQTTQLVVGASDESDEQIARAAFYLYRRLGLARVYYSGFHPVAGTPLQEKPPESALRERRLYQADFLLRAYGFDVDEIAFGADGCLDSRVDPKTAWARLHPERFPVEVNTAPQEQLLRIPGIGPRSAGRLLAMRRQSTIRSLDALRAAGARSGQAAPFILLDGRCPEPGARQLELFTGG